MYQRIRDLREDHDKTQKEIATYLCMQVTVYQRYERGEREIPLWAAINWRICTVLRWIIWWGEPDKIPSRNPICRQADFIAQRLHPPKADFILRGDACPSEDFIQKAERMLCFLFFFLLFFSSSLFLLQNSSIYAIMKKTPKG